jgi:hypothetical protein
MNYREYLYAFIERKCPKCGFLDTSNSLGNNIPLSPENKKSPYSSRGIILRYVDF